MIPYKKIIKKIKSKVNIVDEINDYISLEKLQKNYMSLSPFIDEKTPSFFVSPSKQIFKCFASGNGGDVIEFVKSYIGLTHKECILYLTQKYQINQHTGKDNNGLFVVSAGTEIHDRYKIENKLEKLIIDKYNIKDKNLINQKIKELKKNKNYDTKRI
jgi:DNA primase